MSGSVPSVPTQITQAELAYLPATIAAVQVAEASGAAGDTKLQAVLSALGAGSSALESSANPKVAGIAALVNLTVAVMNVTGGLFKHRAKSV